MAECEHFSTTCRVFFSEGTIEELGIAGVLKQRYCGGPERASCARLLVHTALGSSAVPKNLWPNDTAIAAKLISRAAR